MRRDSHAAADPRPARCLLVSPRGQDVPVDLLDGLWQRGVTLREVNDAPSAMAALAEEPFGVMVIVSPRMQREAEPLARAVRRYHPGVGLWRYDLDDEPRLARLTGGTGDRSGTGFSRRAGMMKRGQQAPATNHGRDGDATDHGLEAHATAHATDDEQDAHATPSMHLTREELAMLLDENDHDHDAGRPDAPEHRR